ncbi:MAG: hypothetical protein RLZZ04_4828 [Cyanobacteriota bacterium]
MAIPLLAYSPSCPNQRVDALGARNDEAIIYSTDDLFSPTDVGNLIQAAYRQIFFHAFKWDQEIVLESQLRNRQITVRDFIRGLLLSNTFIDSFYHKNSNYRFVEHCIQKVLGRKVYSKAEKIAWSAVVMTKGVKGFIDELLDSDEYIDNFGENIVPYQSRFATLSPTINDPRLAILVCSSPWQKILAPKLIGKMPFLPSTLILLSQSLIVLVKENSI